MSVLFRYTDMRNWFALTAGVSTTANDGYETWPVDMLNANGFDDGFTGIDSPITALPMTVSVDGEANGAEAHHAYLSQRTDTAADQLLTIGAASGKSGTWIITSTALLDERYDSGSLSTDDVEAIFKHVSLYVQRISDGAIQFVEILRTSKQNEGEE